MLKCNINEKVFNDVRWDKRAEQQENIILVINQLDAQNLVS